MNRDAKYNRSGAFDVVAVFAFLGAVFTAGAAPSAADSSVLRKARRIPASLEERRVASMPRPPFGRFASAPAQGVLLYSDLAAGSGRFQPVTSGSVAAGRLGERGALVIRKAGQSVAVHAEEVPSAPSAPAGIPSPERRAVYLWHKTVEVSEGGASREWIGVPEGGVIPAVS